MGQATDALFAYGYDLGDPEDAWNSQETTESGLRLPCEWWRPGQDDPSFLEAAQARIKEAGVNGLEVYPHGAHTHPDYLLSVHTVTARRGYPRELDIPALMRRRDAEEWDDLLAAGLKALGLTPLADAPAWLLAPYAELNF